MSCLEKPCFFFLTLYISGEGFSLPFDLPVELFLSRQLIANLQFKKPTWEMQTGLVGFWLWNVVAFPQGNRLSDL